MVKLLSYLLLVFSLLNCNVAVAGSDNPFAKNDRINIGRDVSWKIDRPTTTATKSISSDKGIYYHLGYNNKQIKLALSSDEKGFIPKKLSQLEVTDVKLDGKRLAIFKWCLNNQQRHNRFLQQSLSVKNNVCVISGNGSSFVMRLNKDTLSMLQRAKRLTIVIKPFRTRLELNYDISDFADMALALNVKAKKAIAVAPKNSSSGRKGGKVKKCWAGPPAKYKNIKSIEYDCFDAVSKKDAEAWVKKLVVTEKKKREASSLSAKIAKKKAAEKKRLLALEKEKKRKLVAENKKKQLADQLQQEKKLQAEAVAIAASKANQTKINDDITLKMVNVCRKYWGKGEHRCYCQKYIKHAPASIQAGSTCK